MEKEKPELDDKCGRYLTFRDFIQCGETLLATHIENLPLEKESYSAIANLARSITDPVMDYFGVIKLTYGFCSHELSKKIPGKIDPKIDQHAACELDRSGRLVCKRKGAAVDFIVEDESMLEVAQWVVEHCNFDRLYFYGDNLPVHVSAGPQGNRKIALMKDKKGGGLRPQMISAEKFRLLTAEDLA
jgi:hypothetical protein